MRPFLYRCPNTARRSRLGLQMTPKTMTQSYLQMSCLACAQAHLINPKTVKVLGSEEIRPASGQSSLPTAGELSAPCRYPSVVCRINAYPWPSSWLACSPHDA